MKRSRALAAALLGVALSFGSVASAQTDEERRATARELAEKAQDQIADGDHEAALDLLRQADDAYHAPTITLLIGRSLVALGRIAEAAETFDALAAETLAADAPPAWANAQALARTERSALDDRLAKLTVTVEPADLEVTIKIGERKSGPARGEHLVDAEQSADVRFAAPGHRSEVRTVSIGAGETSELAIVMVPLAAGEPPPPPIDEKPASTSFLATPWPTLIAGGTAGLALVIGAGLGAAAFSEAGELEDRCGDPSCSGASPADRQELLDIQSSGGSLADGSTVAFVVSGVAATAAGVFLVLWVTADEGGKKPPEASASVRGGPGWVSLNGSF